ncbi:MAG: type IX secretion system membrane protein PorP/SprF [Flavobacteriales bacterium]|nr:type IX secretion system membrane protein PorP/SprF [Flavobacteriales bacterium]MBP9078689.1 type IX secretion system membrane protein PorP/SprF [Flavobacteriales bacterium]
MKRTICFAVAGLLVGLLHGQDADPSFAGSAPLLLDPSRSGFSPGGQVSFIHRDQWLQLPGTWRSDQLAAEWCARNTRKPVESWLGIALIAQQDRQAVEGGRRTVLDFTSAMHVRAGRRSFLSSGIEARLADQQVGDVGGTWGSQYGGGRYDPGLATGEGSGTGRLTTLEMRVGLSYTLKYEEESRLRRELDMLVAGIAADHIGGFSLHEEGAPVGSPPIRLTAYVLGELPHELWDKGFFSAELIGQAQGPFLTGRIGVFAGKHLLNAVREPGGPMLQGFKAGLSYRLHDALLVNAALDLGRTTFGMAYGWSIFNPNKAVAGRRTFELLAQVRFVKGGK